MPPRKVWNEDLCRALKARQEQCQRLGRQQQYMWRDGHKTLEAVRRDIYKFSTGRLVNLPTGNLTKTVLKLCEDIINEKEPILPHGYIPTNTQDASEGNPYERDPYLKKIKLRGGAFAILMAFHHSKTTTLTRSEIIREGQRHCDDEMDRNMNAGRFYGAFDSNKTLVRHGLVIRNNAIERKNDSAHTYTITREGEKFIEALLQKFPDAISGGNVANDSVSSQDTTHSYPAKRVLPIITPTSQGNSKVETKESPTKRNRCIDLMGRRSEKQSYHALQNQPSAKRKLFPPPARLTPPSQTIIEILSSDSEEEEESDAQGERSKKNPDVIAIDDDEKNQENGTQTMKQKRLAVLIDSRERNRNATPRHLRVQLTNALKNGVFRSIWPVNALQIAEVEERKLDYGDFAFCFGKGANEKRLGIVVERKRVCDLVQRSVTGDHWKQLATMRDCCKHNILLIENDPRRADTFTAYGASDTEERFDPYDTTIQDEDGIFRLMGRLLLSSPSVKFVQTRDEQSSLRSIGALGLVAATTENFDDTAPVSSPGSLDEQGRLLGRLKQGGVPWTLAKRIAQAIGSVRELDRLYSTCISEKCREALLVPLLSVSTFENGMKSTPWGWSEAIYRVYFSSVERSAVISRAMDEYRHQVPDHGHFLSLLHTKSTPEDALDAVRGSPRTHSISTQSHNRVVTIKLSQEQLIENFSWFDQDATATSPFRFDVKDDFGAHTIVMKTSLGSLASSRLFIHIQKAKTVTNIVLDAIQNSFSALDSISTSRATAALLNSQYIAAENKTKMGRDRRVLLLCGLQPALDAAAKKVGARSELPVIMDMVLAELMLVHDVVVIQSLRLSGDAPKILRQLLFACLHYHLLIDEDEKPLRKASSCKTKQTLPNPTIKTGNKLKLEYYDNSDDDSLPDAVFSRRIT